MMMLFRCAMLSVWLICIPSLILTGIKCPPIIYEGQIISRGFYESFIYLVVCVFVLTICFIGSFCVKIDVNNRKNKIAIYLCVLSLVLLGLALLYCDYYAINNNYLWGESAIIWFIASIPSTIGFLVGIIMLIYLLNKEKIQ